MAESPPVRTLGDARWACRSCAACCHGFDYGPVEPEIIERLRKNRIEDHWEPARRVDAWATQRTGPDGAPHWYLTHLDGHCVFLRPDRLCAIHAMFGPEAKPGFCREFPYYLVEDPQGWSAVVRPDCEGWVESFLDGPDIAAEAQTMVALPRVMPRKRFFPKSVTVAPGARVTLDAWMGIEADLLREIEIAAVRDPRADLAAVRSSLGASLRMELPIPSPGSAHLASRAVALALHGVMQRVLAMPVPPGGMPHQVAFAREAAARIADLVERTENRVPLRFDPQGRGYLRLLLRSALLSKRWQSQGEVFAGLGRHLWEVLAASTLASRDGGVDTREMARHHTAFTRFSAIGLIQTVLVRAGPALTDLFLHTSEDCA